MRFATKDDVKSILEMPPYSKSKVTPHFEEDILVAERNGKVLGAVSIGYKSISYMSEEWKEKNVPPLNSEMQRLSGPWISRLYVFPEHRYQGIGTKLVEESVEHLKKKGATEAYAGIHINNAFKVISHQIFKTNGFKRIGSCICLLPKGFCQGTLLKKAIAPSEHSVSIHMQTERKPKELTEEIITLGLNNGAELVGFASAEIMEAGAPKGHKPSDLMPHAKSVIVLACGRNLNEDRNYFYKWGPHFSLTYIRLKDEVKLRRQEARQCIEAVKNLLIERKFKAVTEPHGWSGILSFKMACYLAGLGAFGKGGFLVHPQLGTINVLACIITDAPLQCGTPLKTDVCKNCAECIKACKYGAFKKTRQGFKWIPEKCRSYDLIMNPVTLKWTYGPCNSKCVNACPIGKSSS